MALQLNSVAPSGATGSYWRVMLCNLDASSRTANAEIALYINQEARMSGNEPLFNRQYTFNYNLFVSDENSIKTIYDQLKILPEFINAVDC